MSYPPSISSQFGRLEPHTNVSKQTHWFHFRESRFTPQFFSIFLLGTYCMSWIEDSKVNKADCFYNWGNRVLISVWHLVRCSIKLLNE